MATNHTTNYNLNLWEANDKFVREEFNENTTKLDAAIKAVDTKANTKADQTALTALTQTVNTKANQTALNTLTQTVAGKAQIVVGSYTGDGAAGRTISVGFTPKAVLVITQRGFTYLVSSGTYNPVYGGLAVTGSNGGDGAIEIVSGGFKVAYNGTYLYSNNTNYTYNYIAFV